MLDISTTFAALNLLQKTEQHLNWVTCWLFAVILEVTGGGGGIFQSIYFFNGKVLFIFPMFRCLYEI